VDWIGLAQDTDKWRTLANAVMNLRLAQNAGKLSSDFTTGDLSSSAQLLTVTGEQGSHCGMNIVV
jgi:hypothetical protein